MAPAAPLIIMAAIAAAQTMSNMEKKRSEAKAASEQADYMEGMAAVERAQAQQSADSLRLQRDMEKSMERRSYEEQMARARVGGASEESLLAGANRYSLDAGRKDWLTGQQSRDIVNTGALRSLGYANRSAMYGAQAKNIRQGTTLLAGGADMLDNMYRMYSTYRMGMGGAGGDMSSAGASGAASYGAASGAGSYGASAAS